MAFAASGIGSGILSRPGAGPMPAQSQPQQSVAPESDGEAVSPEEQRQYDEFVNNGLELIYPQGEQAAPSPAIMAQLQGQFPPELGNMLGVIEPPLSETPADNVALTAVLVTMMLEGSAEQAGQQISDDVVMHGGTEIVEALIELAEAAGLHDFTEADIETTTYRAFDLYRVLSPRVDQDALANEFGQVVEADRAGQLGKVLPGLPGFDAEG